MHSPARAARGRAIHYRRDDELHSAAGGNGGGRCALLPTHGNTAMDTSMCADIGEADSMAVDRCVLHHYWRLMVALNKRLFLIYGMNCHIF
jgi:hypothetical protein